MEASTQFHASFQSNNRGTKDSPVLLELEAKKLSMKKGFVLLLGLLAVMMSSCIKSTTYEIYNGTSGFSMYDVKAYEYSGSTVIGYYDVGFLNSNASSGSIEAAKDARQVKVAFKFLPNGEVYTTADYYNLTKNGHTVILLEDNTYVRGGSKDTEAPISKLR